MRKCPLVTGFRLLAMVMGPPDMLIADNVDECQRDNCAWWDDYEARCVLVALNELPEIRARLGVLAEVAHKAQG